jgi:hypothetical protein
VHDRLVVAGVGLVSVKSLPARAQGVVRADERAGGRSDHRVRVTQVDALIEQTSQHAVAAPRRHQEALHDLDTTGEYPVAQGAALRCEAANRTGRAVQHQTCRTVYLLRIRSMRTIESCFEFEAVM